VLNLQSNLNRSCIPCAARDAVWRLGGALVCAAYLGLAACSGTDEDLSRFIAQTKNEPAGPVVPLPEIKPAESFVYNAYELRSPFMPSQPRGGEFLEQDSLDAVKMVGTLRLGDQIYELVETKDGLVHRVTTGNHTTQARLDELLREIPYDLNVRPIPLATTPRRPYITTSNR
jgi:Pilus assembly protein, PilP